MATTNGTPTRFRRFDVAVGPERPEPSFEVAYRVRTTGEPETQVFRCLPDMPGGALADLVIASSQALGVRVESAVGLIRDALVPEDEARWDDLIRSKDRIVTADTIADISEWLVEEYLGAPFVSPSDSAPGP